MDNGYEEIVVGDVCQAGDQYKLGDSDWSDVSSVCHGKPYTHYDFDKSIWRRPTVGCTFELDDLPEPKSYATPTEKVAEHLSGVVDIVRMESALKSEKHILPSGLSKEEARDNIIGNAIPRSSISDIPDGKLTWLAENLDAWPYGKACVFVEDDKQLQFFNKAYSLYIQGGAITHNEWRDKREEPGLPCMFSSAQEEWTDGLPPVGVEILWLSEGGTWTITKVVAYNEDRSSVWLEGQAIVSTDNKARLKPAKEDKGREELIIGIDKVLADAIELDLPMAQSVYDWLKSTGKLKGKGG